ncbi:MAG: hypothetical protein AB7O67_15275 [Vicinamibacterales bacterium]
MSGAADSARAQSESIVDLELAFGRFAGASLERLKAAETALRRTTSQLEERRGGLRRRLTRLQEEIDSAGEDDDTSHAQRQYEETEEALANVVRWQSAVDEAAVRYLREASHLQDLGHRATPEARATLRKILNDLGAYFALQQNVAGIGNAKGDFVPANPHGHTPTERDAVRAVASLLASAAGLGREDWNNLATPNARLEVLQKAENAIASLSGRPALPVLPGNLEPQEYGVCDGEAIWVNEDYLEPGCNQEMIRTIVHEGRHAMQYHACSNPDAHQDSAQVEAWQSNLRPGGYIEWRENPERYMSQPVEADAFAYEDAVMSAYIDEGGD